MQDQLGESGRGAGCRRRSPDSAQDEIATNKAGGYPGSGRPVARGG